MKFYNGYQKIRFENILDNKHKLLINSIDLNTPLKSGIPCFYGYNGLEDVIF